MSIPLNQEETTLKNEIEERMAVARRAFAASRIDDNVAQVIAEAGERAHRLHMLLKDRGIEPKHHAYMIKNRELQPADPEFYMHFHPLEDLLKFLDDPNANNDPVDQTIGADFTFRVYSRRWGPDDTYQIVRTADGWEINHMQIGGPCDKSGRPFLFSNFRQDLISYPTGLEDRFEWLWNEAASKGLTKAQVQTALQELADWVSKTEQTAPSGGVWEGH